MGGISSAPLYVCRCGRGTSNPTRVCDRCIAACTPIDDPIAVAYRERVAKRDVLTSGGA